MKKGGGSESTIIIGPSKSVLFYTLHCLEYVLGLARFRVFVPKLYYIITLGITFTLLHAYWITQVSTLGFCLKDIRAIAFNTNQ